MTDSDDLFAALKTFVETELGAELDRHARAGHPMSRRQALDMANAHLREKLILMAEQHEKNGKDESAAHLRDLAEDVPGLVRELGLI